MDEKAVSSTYFTRPGPENTARTLEIARARADELGVQAVLVASTRGATGALAAEVLRGHNLIVVSHAAGFREPNSQELGEAHRRAITEAGARILTCQHAFGGVGRAVRRKLQTYQLEEIIAYTLRVFGEGTKVACEITLMAADAGLIRVGEPVVAVAGTSGGADTALVILPANASSFFDLQVMEVLCKPHRAAAGT